MKHLTWSEILLREAQQPYWHKLTSFLNQEEKLGRTTCPLRKDIFRALKLCPIHKVKVVILGQDPYHGLKQANGLAFSVERGHPLPPTLVNIFKELERDTNIPAAQHGDLTYWAQQGVLLLNTLLSVRQGEALSHSGVGWEELTRCLILEVNQLATPVVFLLWGSHAKSYLKLNLKPYHFILTASHPSPLSYLRGFWGCGHFTLVNTILQKTGRGVIDWRLP